MLKVLIFGRRHGYLASLYAGYYAGDNQVVVSDVDVRRLDAVEAEIAQVKPTLVINAAGRTHGKTAQNIDGCEETTEMRHDTLRVNVHGAINVRNACADVGVRLVHLGSGCVYDGKGTQAMTETDAPDPVSWYAATKAVGDAEVVKYEQALVLRLRMPFGEQPHPRNLLTKLGAYPYVVDAPNSITYLPSLLMVTTRLLIAGARGMFNVVQPDIISPYRLASLGRFDVQPWTPEELNAHVVARRSNCVLSTAKLTEYGITLPTVASILGVNEDRIAWQAGSA